MFKVSKQANRWAMTIPTKIIECDDAPVGVDLMGLVVRRVEEELESRNDVQRMSYDTWYWQSQSEMNNFITYYHLKYDQPTA